MEDIRIHTAVEAPLLVEHHFVFGIEGQLMCHILVMTVARNGVSLCHTFALIAVKTTGGLWLEAVISIVMTETNVMTWIWTEVESCSIAKVIDR